LDELLAIVTIPPVHPVCVGVKFNFRATVWPAPTATGSLSPDTLKAELLELTALTVTLVCPVFVKVTS
jgi:hypothetical protein